MWDVVVLKSTVSTIYMNIIIVATYHTPARECAYIVVRSYRGQTVSGKASTHWSESGYLLHYVFE